MGGPHPVLLLVGTDADQHAGGVGAALRGFEAAAEAAGIPCERFTSHRAGGLGGKVLPWHRVRQVLRVRVGELRSEGKTAVVYAHAGSWPSLVRKADILGNARFVGARTLFHLHGVQLDSSFERSAFRCLFRQLTRSADRLVVPSAWWRDRVAGAHPVAKIDVLPNPLAPEVLEAAAVPRPAREETGLHVVAMTRLVGEKGVGATLDAVAGMGPGVRLTVAGDGSRRRALECRAADLGARERVRFVGWLAGEEKWSLLRTADVFCLPGAHDAFPMAVAEAMAFGLPVVAGRQRAIPDLVPDGVAGILVEPLDASDVTRALQALQDASLRARLGGSGRARVAEHFTPEVVGAELARILGELPRRVDT